MKFRLTRLLPTRLGNRLSTKNGCPTTTISQLVFSRHFTLVPTIKSNGARAQRLPKRHSFCVVVFRFADCRHKNRARETFRALLLLHLPHELFFRFSFVSFLFFAPITTCAERSNILAFVLRLVCMELPCCRCCNTFVIQPRAVCLLSVCALLLCLYVCLQSHRTCRVNVNVCPTF